MSRGSHWDQSRSRSRIHDSSNDRSVSIADDLDVSKLPSSAVDYTLADLVGQRAAALHRDVDVRAR